MRKKYNFHSYEEIITYLRGLDNRMKEMDEEIKANKTIFNIRKRIKCARLKDEFNSCVDEWENLTNFLGELTTISFKSFASFLAKFYSFEMTVPLEAIGVVDNSTSKHGRRTYVVMSKMDYSRLAEKYKNFNHAVNVDDLFNDCNDFIIKLICAGKKFIITEGVSFSNYLNELPETIPVIIEAINIMISNRKKSIEESLNEALINYELRNSSVSVPTQMIPTIKEKLNSFQAGDVLRFEDDSFKEKDSSVLHREDLTSESIERVALEEIKGVFATVPIVPTVIIPDNFSFVSKNVEPTLGEKFVEPEDDSLGLNEASFSSSTLSLFAIAEQVGQESRKRNSAVLSKKYKY